MDVSQPLTAGFAKALVLFYALAAFGLVGGAAVVSRRWLRVLPLAAAGIAAVALVATLTMGGEAWSLAAVI